MNYNYQNKNRGFTLIELMVSMSIFMMVMLLALGSLVNISNVAKKSRSLHQAMDNVNFAMESMTRSLRTGSNYYCASSVFLGDSNTLDCNGEDTISFTSQDATDPSIKNMAYALNSINNSLQKCVLGNSCVDMTSSDVVVESLKFDVKGSSKIDSIQPGVYISMKGTVTIGSEKNSFALQTFVSQRNTE